METLLQHFINAFGWSILNSLWQSAVVYGILFLTLFSLPKLAAKHKHNLAFGAILLMFAAFAYNLITKINLAIPKQVVNEQLTQAQFQQYFNNLPESFSSRAERYFPIVAVFYVIGILLQSLVILRGYQQLSRFKKESLTVIPEEWQHIFERVSARLNIKKYIQFHISAIVNVPVVIGYFKPVVLFPIALVNQLDTDQVEAILIHELSHVRRNDFLLNLIKTAIETLLFYNPFVWLAGRFIHIEREHACDDLVLKVTGKPLNYAHALLKLELLKDKNSPAYALAATGKTQNLYQRIKRITNMKTNYLNAKQQMAALTLGVACLFSIAWINPATKKQIKHTPKEKHTKIELKITNPEPVIYLDTNKKRKIKIVTIDANGKRTEYNSVKDMPDSVRKDFYKEELFGNKNVLRINLDSNLKFKDSLFRIKIDQQFNSPEAQAKWKKMGEEMAKKFNSPEEQAKWKKFGEEMAKKFNSPEAQAKWKKMGEDMEKKFNSPEEQAKWKKFGEDMAKEFGSEEAQEKWRKIGEDMEKKFTSPEFQAQIDIVRAKALKEVAIAKRGIAIENLSRRKADSLLSINGELLSSSDGRVLYLNDNSNSNLKQSAEYKKLKNKFDKEVSALKQKMEKAKKKNQ
ncbi:M56 family metallopeptidase [Pedobacter sandarakinus]|uniref:M56 family metallopeptidase n=1 Tax=Pedobacter sandarakinus TaxID=353156 RepID=UPI002246E4AF|nr:M56 family metallopeptidase [Pedobacter sandarakinus]MCX2575596.1 M56 family metallopeptidase [Pedobacter sandarakinus]